MNLRRKILRLTTKKTLINCLTLTIVFVIITSIFSMISMEIEKNYLDISMEQMENNDEVIRMINDLNAIRTFINTIYYIIIGLIGFGIGYNIYVLFTDKYELHN